MLLMNRREFTKSIAAAGIAPLVPLPAGATASVAKVAPNFSPFSYMWSAHYARLKGDCSAEILAGRFDLAPDVAREINRRLIKNGVISVPNALGISKATTPHLSGIKTTGQMAAKVKSGKSPGDLLQKAKAKLDDFVEEPQDDLPAQEAASTEPDQTIEDA